ncbi:histidine kinase [Rhizobium sp. A22-96]
MKKKIIALALLVFASPLAVHAATLKFPSEKPVASITIPDSWKPEETDSGVQGTSADSAIYLSADVASSKSMDKVVTDAIDFLAKNKITVDPSTRKETPVTDVNGMQMTTLEWDGSDEDGPVSVGLLFVQTSGDNALVVTYWGTKGEEDKHAAEVQAIIASIKPVE